MITNKQHTVLPFYTAIEQQWRNMYAGNAHYKDVKIICPKNRLLPFEIVRNPSPLYLTSLKLYCVEDDSFNDLLEDIPANQITYNTASGKDYIQYSGTKDLEAELPCGWYYLVATDGNKIWYSEIFVVMNFDETDISAITYDGENELAATDIEAIKYN